MLQRMIRRLNFNYLIPRLSIPSSTQAHVPGEVNKNIMDLDKQRGGKSFEGQDDVFEPREDELRFVDVLEDERPLDSKASFLNIGIVGGTGNFGSATFKELQKNLEGQIFTSSRTTEKMNVNSMTTSELAEKSDILFFFPKPKDMEVALKEAAPGLKKNALMISAAAAYPVAAIRKFLNRKDVGIIRFMSSLSLDAIFFYAPPGTSDVHKQMAENLFPSKKIYWLTQEHQLEAVVAYIGCLPGVLYSMLGALADRAKADGLPNEIISEAILRTVQGTGSYPLKTNKPIDFRKEEQKVATKGGFTAGINLGLDQQNVQRIFARALSEAAEKCRYASDQNLPKEAVVKVLPTGPLTEHAYTQSVDKGVKKEKIVLPEKSLTIFSKGEPPKRFFAEEVSKMPAELTQMFSKDDTTEKRFKTPYFESAPVVSDFFPKKFQSFPMISREDAMDVSADPITPSTQRMEKTPFGM